MAALHAGTPAPALPSWPPDVKPREVTDQLLHLSNQSQIQTYYNPKP